ncbi:MAG: phosphoribosylglycinamide formyltransferase [Alphaproteobacteria bacterium]|nr:phosphoribosylglycinamide formyltransferase [Alphaproteobacteria bacterium]
MGASANGNGAGRRRVAILVSGRGSNMASLIEAARNPDYPAEIALVLSNRPGALGLARAEAAGIATRSVDHRAYGGREPFEAALHQALLDARIDIVCLAGFMRLLTAGFVARWHDRMLNIHPSILPAFKGLDTHRRALEAGVRIHGCTVHLVRAEMDGGPIVAQAAVPVLPDDTEDSLAARVLAEEHRIYPLALGLLAGGRIAVEGERVRIAGHVPPAGPALVNPAG